MREILFRGKATNRIKGRPYRTNYKNGDWVYGLLTDVLNYSGFSEMTNTNGVSGIDVDPETVGQFTGKKDRNKKRIFDGDICRFLNDDGEYTDSLVYWDDTQSQWRIRAVEYRGTDELDAFYAERCEIIGNQWDNPELLTKEGA